MNRFLYILLIAAAVVLMPFLAHAEDAAAGGAAGQVVAQEETDTEQAVEEEQPPVQYVLEPELTTYMGYRHFDSSGAYNRAAKYEWPYQSALLGLSLAYNPLPHRMDAELEWKSLYDREAEFSYSYKDVLKADYLGWALWHNLDNANIGAGFNIGNHFHTDVSSNRAYFRLKWPDRAYHVFFELRNFEKEGDVQARFFNGGGKVSKARAIDWITNRYTAGFNGHFGPIELEYSHMAKEFTPHATTKLTDAYLGFLVRDHNITPPLFSHSETVKAHTDYTGRVVASATYVTGGKKNDNSNARVEFNRAYGDITIIPFTDVTVAIRYRYKDLTESVPAVFGTRVLGAAGVANATKPPINSRTNRAEVSVRYSPMINLGVKAEYSYENTRRDNTPLWSDPGIVLSGVPSDQTTHRVKLGLNARPARNAELTGSLEYAYTNDPAYPTKPRNSYKGRLHADWTPLAALTAGVYYRFAAENNPAPRVLMSTMYHNAGAVAVWTPRERLFFSVGYDFFSNKNARDIELTHGTSPDVDFLSDNVPYRDAAHVYTLAGGYAFSFPLSLDAEFHQSWSHGGFRTSVSDGTATTAGLGDFSDLSVRETGGSFTASYGLPKGWGASLRYGINNYEDFKDHPTDGPQDGTAHTVLVMVSKKW